MFQTALCRITICSRASAWVPLRCGLPRRAQKVTVNLGSRSWAFQGGRQCATTAPSNSIGNQRPVSGLADRMEMQRCLFAALSEMFGKEVPLYTKSVAVNKVCNQVVVSLFGSKFSGFNVSDESLDRTSGERHGAIRIGSAEEYKWVGRFFNVFGMEPHSFYDMTNLGSKSQPIIATAFRSAHQPEHRMFTSLLRTDYFDEETKSRIDGRLAHRQVISDEARALIEKSERQGGLDWSDAQQLIGEATAGIFSWRGEGWDYNLYRDLCDAGFNIAADVACFGSHHLNHLTPNSLCIDVYTAAMKFCLRECDEAAFRAKARAALAHLAETADHDFLRLHFRHLTWREIENCKASPVESAALDTLVDTLVHRLSDPEFALHMMSNSGFKDSTEGPPVGVPVLLRQDSYKALPERVAFQNPDGSVTEATHTARFGEVEQRFFATTSAGRELYDRCLSMATESSEAESFARFPTTLDELVDDGLVFVSYEPTEEGLAARGAIEHKDVSTLVQQGYVRREGQRYEDFLPFSAAGIFASNLKQYGTKSTAAEKPIYTKETLEEILGRPVIDPTDVCREVEERSLRETLAKLGI